MIKQNHPQYSSASPRALSAKFILTGLIAAAANFALPASSSAQISTFDFTLDGQFTNGFTAAGPLGEWSDVTPFSFISSPTGTIPTSNSDSAKNTQLYAAISHDILSAPGDLQLHLMYDFKPRTLLPLPGEIFATVTFPVTIQGRAKDNISVVFRGSSPPALQASGTAPSFFDVFVDLDVNNPTNPLIPAFNFPGLLGSVSFSGSPLDANPHLLVELEVPLRIQSGFATPPPSGTGLPGGGINPATGMYDPDPVFWGASAAGNGSAQGSIAGNIKLGEVAPLAGGLQDATSVFIGINPTGSLTVTPVPEPSTAVLLLGGLSLIGARRRQRVSAE